MGLMELISQGLIGSSSASVFKPKETLSRTNMEFSFYF